MGVKASIIEKSGSWFSYNSTRIGQGRENARDFLKANPEMTAEIEKAIRNKTEKLSEELLGTPEPDANDGDESL
jgi:recombination protein RecA